MAAYSVLRDRFGPKYDRALLWAQRAVSGGSMPGMIILSALLSDGPETLRDRDTAHAPCWKKPSHSAAGLPG